MQETNLWLPVGKCSGEGQLAIWKEKKENVNLLKKAAMKTLITSRERLNQVLVPVLSASSDLPH